MPENTEGQGDRYNTQPLRRAMKKLATQGPRPPAREKHLKIQLDSVFCLLQ